MSLTLLDLLGLVPFFTLPTVWLYYHQKRVNKELSRLLQVHIKHTREHAAALDEHESDIVQCKNVIEDIDATLTESPLAHLLNQQTGTDTRQ